MTRIEVFAAGNLALAVTVVAALRVLLARPIAGPADLAWTAVGGALLALSTGALPCAAALAFHRRRAVVTCGWIWSGLLLTVSALMLAQSWNG